MTALREELIDCINTLSYRKLNALKPLLFSMREDTPILEILDFDDLDDDEKDDVIEGRKAYNCGDCIDFEDYIKERQTV